MLILYYKKSMYHIKFKLLKHINKHKSIYITKLL